MISSIHFLLSINNINQMIFLDQKNLVELIINRDIDERSRQ